MCGKKHLKKMHIHHVFGRADSSKPLVALCPGCHELVSSLAIRVFLRYPHKVADLITLARFAAKLPDAKTIVKYKEEGHAKTRKQRS